LETVHPSALAPINSALQWKGGLTYIVIIRYEDPPAEPYDELVVVSDGFANPYNAQKGSVWNGRNSWSIVL
jgi:hypothetical protein